MFSQQMEGVLQNRKRNTTYSTSVTLVLLSNISATCFPPSGPSLLARSLTPVTNQRSWQPHKKRNAPKSKADVSSLLNLKKPSTFFPTR